MDIVRHVLNHTLKSYLLILFLSSFLVTESYAVNVYGSGFSYLGSAEHVESAFPYTQKLSLNENLETSFDAAFLRKVKDEKFNFNYIIKDLASLGDEEALTFTLALQQEKTSIEEIGGVFKVLIELEAQLLFFDFNSMSIVASYPINLQYIDVSEETPSENYIEQKFNDIYFGSSKINFFDIAVERLKAVRIKKRYSNYIQVVNSSISDSVLNLSPNKSKGESRRLSQYYAQSFSQLMSSNQDISVLPYMKGHAIGSKLSGRYANGEVYSLEIPEPDYAVDINIAAFKKKLFSENKSGKSFIYAAQAEFNFYEPLSQRTYFHKKLFNGATKVIPSSQVIVDDWAAYNDSLKILFDKFTRQLGMPSKKWLKKHSGSSDGYKSFLTLKKVIDQCR